jgi:hypothetical protein
MLRHVFEPKTHLSFEPLNKGAIEKNSTRDFKHTPFNKSNYAEQDSCRKAKFHISNLFEKPNYKPNNVKLKFTPT